MRKSSSVAREIGPSPSASSKSLASSDSWRLMLLALGAILFVAAYTRLARLDLIDFKADEALIAGITRDVLQGKWPTTSIQTSLGPFNPPLFVYLLSLPMMLSTNPAVLTGFVGLLDLIAVAGTFFVGRRFFGARVGLVSALLFAADPYATIFARKMAGTFVEPLVSVLLLWCLLGAVSGAPAAGAGRRQALTWTAGIVCLGLLVQLHPGTLLLVPVVALLFAVYGRRRALLPAVLGLSLVAAMFAPYLIFELTRQPDFFRTLTGLAGGPSRWDISSFALVWTMLSSSGYSDLAGAVAAVFRAEDPFFGLLTPAIGLASAAGLLVALRRWRDPRHFTLAAFVLLPLILTLRHSNALQIHYFAFLEPALFLLGGIGVNSLVSLWPSFLEALKRRGWRIGEVRSIVPAVPYTVLGALLLVQVLGFRHFVAFLQQHQLTDAYGLPLHYEQEVLSQASQLAAGDRIVVATANRDQVDTARYLLHGQRDVEVDSGAGLLFPGEDRAIYVTLGQNTAAGEVLRRALVPRRLIRLPGGQDFFAVYVLAPNSVDDVAQRLGVQPAQERLANGANLLGWGAPSMLPGQLVSLWRVGRTVDPSTTIFNQLLDDGGKQWFDRDEVPVQASAWRAGDQLLQIVQASLPADAPRQEYWWVTGMYTVGGRRVPTADGGNQLRVARLNGGLPSSASPPAVPLNATFAQAIRLSGYTVLDGSLRLYFTCLKPLDRDYTVFVHLIGPDGAIVAQHDAQPLEGRYPTSLWQPGETVLDPVPLSVPAGSRMELGLYDLKSGERLKLADGSDHVTIGIAGG